MSLSDRERTDGAESILIPMRGNELILRRGNPVSVVDTNPHEG